MEIREDFPHLSSVIVIGGIERVSASVEACFPEVIRIRAQTGMKHPGRWMKRLPIKR